MSAISRSWKRAILKLLTYEHCLKMLLLHSNRDLGWTSTKQRGNDVYLLHIARTQAGKTRRIRGRYRRGTVPRRRPRQWPRHHQPPRTEIEPGNGRNRQLGRMRPHRLLLQSRGHLCKLQRSLDAPLRHTLAQRSKQLGESVPPSVTIPAGQTSAGLLITIWRPLPSTSRKATIIAGAVVTKYVELTVAS